MRTDTSWTTRHDGALLITGGGSGIGAAVARRFGNDKIPVVVADRNLTRAQSVADELPAALAVECDVTDEDQVAAAVEAAVGQFKRLRYLVTAAGVADAGPLAEWSRERWDRLQSIHVTGTFLSCRFAVPVIAASGGGAIVTIGSIAAHVTQPGNAAYGAAKGAVVAFSRQLAADVAPAIRVNTVSPGRVRTAMTEPIYRRLAEGDADRGAELSARHSVLHRVAQPAEIAGPICFLLGADASFITGQELIVDGGELIR
jgi:NAD(P)-dependent dehydrogenase (short-subunit alcohol dehydrogenase family)